MAPEKRAPHRRIHALPDRRQHEWIARDFLYALADYQRATAREGVGCPSYTINHETRIVTSTRCCAKNRGEFTGASAKQPSTKTSPMSQNPKETGAQVADDVRTLCEAAAAAKARPWDEQAAIAVADAVQNGYVDRVLAELGRLHAELERERAARQQAQRELAQTCEELERLRRDCSEAYQVIGAGMFGEACAYTQDDVERALDNLFAAAEGEPRPHDDLLPWPK
jgi:hypothetical protein